MIQGVKNRHPQITPARIAEWDLMRDAFNGESAVKLERQRYLPMPPAFADSGAPARAYDDYMARAQFPEILAPSIGAMVGIVHGQESQIEMPDGMNFLYEDATDNDLPLEAFHQRITRQLLTYGRYSILADAPEGGGDPFMTGYAAGALINWDRDFYVLDETYLKRDGFEWAQTERYRVLEIEEGRYVQRVYEKSKSGALELAAEFYGTSQGDKGLTAIPFVVANARDIIPEIETPPMIGVARIAIANYQLNADYRHQLYMSGQETLVAINGEAPEFVGAGAVISMSGSEGMQPDLKYVSPSCSGIDAHERAIEANRQAAIMAGAKMMEQGQQTQESGEARKLRIGGENANLMSVSLVSAGLLERGLKDIAVMMGLNPDDVTVTPPKQLMIEQMTPVEAEALVRVWMQGGISYQTMYEALQRGGIASDERDFEAEFGLINDEQFGNDQDAI